MTDPEVVIVGGGHNGLVAAAYLARAGRSVLVLERLDVVGGAAVSAQAFPGVNVRLSRYSYLVSLLPRKIVTDLGLPLRLRRRLPSPHSADPAWQWFYSMTGAVARQVFPTMTEPLLSAAQLRERIEDRAWRALFVEPLSAVLEERFRDDDLRGVVLTDGLIGTFAAADDPSLLQNRCLLYHVIGNGTGDWDVPVGVMGAVTSSLAEVARAAGARLVTGAEVLSVDPDGLVRYVLDEAEHSVRAGHVLVNASPQTLARLLGEEPATRPEGSQLKVNMVLRRLPTVSGDSTPFGGTFHVNESYSQLATAYAQAAAGRIPELPPREVYCHSLADPSIVEEPGAHTLTLFGLHMPARLFRQDNEKSRQQALAATLRSLNSVLDEPIEDCLWLDSAGRPCIEAKTPVDLEAALGLPGGHIFHGDLSWPYAPTEQEVGTWGVETGHPRILLCGAGARRGGGVSGIPGHNAAMAVLRG